MVTTRMKEINENSWCKKYGNKNFLLIFPIVLLLVTIIYKSNGIEKTKRLICYYNLPNGFHDLQPQKIDANLCTHIIVAFFNIKNNLELEETEEKNEILRKIVQLKKLNGVLKVMISVGGAGNIQNWSDMVSNHTNRKIFIKSVRIFLKKFEIDGIDLDWEYPNAMVSNSKEKMHFTQLLEEFRMHINRNSYKFLLSVAVPSDPFRIDISYQVNYLNTFTDFINVMSYDYHFYSTLTPFTGLNSPLFRSSYDNGLFAQSNINDTIIYYEEKSMDKVKINVGVPIYGHTFKLVNQNNNGLYAPADDTGRIGSKGFANYTEILKFLKDDQVEKRFDETSKCPYAIKGFEWISYEDENSIKHKIQFAKTRGYGGVMLYNLNSDDFNGIYSENFTLTRAVKMYLNTE